MKADRARIGWTVLLAVLFLAGCAPGTERYADTPAGFWAGLWHGIIVIVTFIISLFSDTVRIYETSNTGGWYDFGFILGLLISIGQGGFFSSSKKHPCKSEKEREWEEIGKKVEEKVRTGIQKWLSETDKKEDEEWVEIGKKVEEKIRQELKNWAEKK